MSCRDTKRGERDGLCTSALLLNDAKSAGHHLAVGKRRHVLQTNHGARSVVRVAVAVDDADEDAGHAYGKLLFVGLGVFSQNKPCNGSKGLEAAMQG